MRDGNKISVCTASRVLLTLALLTAPLGGGMSSSLTAAGVQAGRSREGGRVNVGEDMK